VYTGISLETMGEVGEGIRTFLVLQATASKINHLDGTFRRVFEQHILREINTGLRRSRGTQYLWLQITMDDAVVPHQR
jgi:hypothetical protein